MNKEMIDHIANQVVGPLQWLTPEEEWLVMELVAEKLKRKKERRDYESISGL